MSQENGCLTRDEVRRFAMETNATVLWRHIQMADRGHCTWDEAMQAAAIYLSQANVQLIDDMRRISSLTISPYVVKENRDV